MSKTTDPQTNQEKNPPTNGQEKEFHTIWDLILKYSQRVGSPKSTRSPASAASGRMVKRHRTLMIILLGFPWLLLAVFIVSFFWDFPGYSLNLWGIQFPLQGLLRILAVGGFIGFGTNWLAITMLFRPLKRRPLLGQGLIPAQKEGIAYRMARAMSRDLINPELIKTRLSENNVISESREQWLEYMRQITEAPDFRDELKELIIRYVRERLNDAELRQKIAVGLIDQLEQGVEHSQFEKIALKTYRLIRGQEMLDIVDRSLLKIPDSLENEMQRLDDLLDRLPEQLETHSESVESAVIHLIFTLLNQLDVHKMIEENIMGMDESRLEGLIKGTTNEQLKYIQYLGALLGAIGGLVIWAPLLSIACLASAGIVVTVLDSLIYRIRRKGEELKVED